MTPVHVARTLREAARSRASVALFVAFLVMWGVGFETELAPPELFFPLFPAAVAAFFLDTVAYNQLGLRVPWLFYPLLVVCLYAEAVLLVALARWIRRRGTRAAERFEGV